MGKHDGSKRTAVRVRKPPKWLFLLVEIIVILLFVYGCLYFWGKANFMVSFYQISSEKIENEIRVVGLSDLHNWEFGKNNKKLVERIQELDPDIILIAGDMMLSGDEDISVVTSLCEQLVQIAPVYYSFGNHENDMVYGEGDQKAFLDEQSAIIGTGEDGMLDFDKLEMVDSRLPDMLKSLGVTILNNNFTSIQIKNQTIDIAGVDNTSGSYFPYSSYMVETFLTTNPQNLKIILAHMPSIPFAAMTYQSDLKYDLVLCGHKHGGIIRIPGLGGMFSGEGDLGNLFSGYDSGMITTTQGNVVVSRGLGNSNFLPRINNTPELVVVDFL